METHEVTTEDGWRIPLRRYPGPGQPVLLVHGMGANSHNFDLNRRWSLARYLAGEGFDSWVVELRGRGATRPPPGGRTDWDFEDFLHRDLAAAVELVQQVRRQPLHWIGHSMGGMLGVAWACCRPQEVIRSLVLFGTPLGFEPGQWALRLWGWMVQVHRVLPTLDQESLGRRLLPLMSRNRKALDFFLRYLANPENIADEVAVEIFEKLVTNESPGIILQFSDWVRCGQIRSADRSYSYTDNIWRVRRPIMFVSGRHDRMAPPRVLERFRPRLGSPEVVQRLLSAENGFSTDYGHGDLVLGRRAPEEVYPLVAEWLRSH